MKIIGLLGGTGWFSTIGYYKTLNELVGKKLGGYHSAKILLKSIDYHDIMSNYGKNHEIIADILENELQELLALKPDCFIICCNSLHKYYDIIKTKIETNIPILHAIELTADYLLKNERKKALLLATKFTMEDGFFTKTLEEHGVTIEIPNLEERNKMQEIHYQLMHNLVTEESRNYFRDLIRKYQYLDAAILGCTEYSMLINETNSALPIVDPVFLQASAAVDFALN